MPLLLFYLISPSFGLYEDLSMVVCRFVTGIAALFEKKTGLISAKYYDGVKLGEGIDWPTIDNVFIHSDKFKVLFFDSYTGANTDYGGMISDHSPVYADLIYK